MACLVWITYVQLMHAEETCEQASVLFDDPVQCLSDAHRFSRRAVTTSRLCDTGRRCIIDVQTVRCIVAHNIDMEISR